MRAFIYELLLHVFAVVMLPKALYSYYVKKRYRKSLAQRFGKNLPEITKKEGQTCLWVHGVSVGEAKAIAPLVKKYREENPSALIVISSITETGHEEAKRSAPDADHYFFLPFDLRYIICPFVRKVSPDVVMLSETDLWYNFLSCAKQCGARLFLVNGKVSKRSLKRYLLFPRFTKHLFSLFDTICVQNETYKKRFEELGCSAPLAVTGNLKLDHEVTVLTEEERRLWHEKLGIKQGYDVLVVGSTHDPEEEFIFEKLAAIWQHHPRLKVIIAPRHPERAKEVARLCLQREIPYTLYSSIEKQTGEEKVVIVDTIGLLQTLYQLATVAVVAGSFTDRVGGHNIIEPMWYGTPVIYGPYMHTQEEFVDLAEEYDAAVQTSKEKLGEVIMELLYDKERRSNLEAAGLTLTRNARGALDATWKVF
jgi:3-deoxy-D-manno-octulosonic-acid transferase